MDLSNLKPAEGSVKKSKRVGRSHGSGKGATSGRGHKGAKSRSGYSKKVGFEGGQMPLSRRLPKYGFTNFSRKEFKGINLDALQNLCMKLNITEITPEVLITNGYASKKDMIKVLGRGELKMKMDVKAHAFSATAKKVIEDLGGSVAVI